MSHRSAHVPTNRGSSMQAAMLRSGRLCASSSSSSALLLLLLRRWQQQQQHRSSAARSLTTCSASAKQQQQPDAAVPWLHSTTNARGEPQQLPTNADAILILAGGQTNTRSGLPAWVERRLDTSLGLQRLQSKPCPILCLGGGTPHKPPILTPKGFVIHESTGCASYLMSKSCDPALILKEVSSYDTVGNAFFSITIHALPAGWRHLVVVTSDFHMPRTRALYRDMCGLAARDVAADPDRFSLTFASSSDDGLFTPEVLEARQDKEAGSLRLWNTHNFQRFSDLHHWLHQTHQCYAVSRQHEFDLVTIEDPRLLASY